MSHKSHPCEYSAKSSCCDVRPGNVALEADAPRAAKMLHKETVGADAIRQS